MDALLLKYGYLILFVGVLVEGEAFLVAAAVLAHRQLFSLPWVIIISVIANSITNQVYYFAARARGKEWLEARFGSHKRYNQITSLMNRHGGWLLVISRFAYGFRIWICAACGVIGMGVLPFALLSLVSGILWAAPTAVVSYYAGGTVLHWLHRAHRVGLWALLGVGVLIATVVGLRHLRRVVAAKDLELSDLHALAPFLIGLMGLLNIASAILRRSPQTVMVVEHWIPLEVVQRSRPFMLFAGVALLQVAAGLARRRSAAWYVAALALGVSFVSHIGRGLDLPHSLVAGLLLLYLVYFRKRFYALSEPLPPRSTVLMVPLLAGVVLLYGGLGFYNMQARFVWADGVDPWGEALREGIFIAAPRALPLSHRASEFQTSLEIAGWLARLYVLTLLLRPVVARRWLELAPPATVAVVQAQGRKSISALVLEPDKHHLLLVGGQGVIGYASARRVVVACGDPVCPGEVFREAVHEFLELARRKQWTPTLYSASEDGLDAYRTMGLETLRIAEEAVIPLQAFSLEGGSRARLRSGRNRAARAGVLVERYDRASKVDPGLDEELEEVSEEWLEDRHLGELRFSFSRFSLDRTQSSWLFVARSKQHLEAFCTFLPYRGGSGAVLDLLRRRRAAPTGTIDLLLAESLLALKSRGFEEASLGSAPLPRDPAERGQIQGDAAIVFTTLDRLYGHKDLFRFKDKFGPAWEGRYLVFPKDARTSDIARALASVHGMEGLLYRLLDAFSLEHQG